MRVSKQQLEVLRECLGMDKNGRVFREKNQLAEFAGSFKYNRAKELEKKGLMEVTFAARNSYIDLPLVYFKVTEAGKLYVKNNPPKKKVKVVNKDQMEF